MIGDRAPTLVLANTLTYIAYHNYWMCFRKRGADYYEPWQKWTSGKSWYLDWCRGGRQLHIERGDLDAHPASEELFVDIAEAADAPCRD